MSGAILGSVLGPALFIICIHDLDANVSSSVHKFADRNFFFSCLYLRSDKPPTV